MKRILIALLLCLPALCFAKPPDQYVNTGTRQPLGYQQLSNAALQSAVKLTSPTLPAGMAGPGFVVIQCQAGVVRWRDDGTAPTASVGMTILSGGELDYAGQISALQFITSSGTPICDVSFYY